MNNDRYSYNDNEISISELFKSLRKNILFIAFVTASITFCSVIYSLFLPNLFTSHSILNYSGSTQSSSSQNNSSITRLTGIKIGMGQGDKADEIIELIKSRGFLEHLITFDDILASITYPKVSGDGSVYISKRIYDEEKNIWSNSNQPSTLDAYDIYIRDLLSIWRDKDTGFINITITHISPIFAFELLSLVIKESNQIMRMRDLEEASDSLSFLGDEIQKTSILEMRNSISSLLQSQLEKKMIANIRKDYVLRTIEPPFIPERKSAPSRLIFVLISSFVALTAALLIVFFRDFVFNQK